jgi:major membrane immunogen (membrane-anchored lipoprotein)
MIIRKFAILVCAVLILGACSASKKASNGTYGSPREKQELINDNTFKITVNIKVIDKGVKYTLNRVIMNYDL